MPCRPAAGPDTAGLPGPETGPPVHWGENQVVPSDSPCKGPLLPRALPPVCCAARTHRLHQTAGTAMEVPAPGPGLAGHSEGHRPGPPRGAAAPTAGRGLPRPGAAVDGREAAVELLAGLGSFQPQGGDGLRGPAAAAGRGRGGGTGPGERGGRMASLEEGAQARHCQRLQTHKEHESLGTARPREAASSSRTCLTLMPPSFSPVRVPPHGDPM